VSDWARDIDILGGGIVLSLSLAGRDMVLLMGVAVATFSAGRGVRSLSPTGSWCGVLLAREVEDLDRWGVCARGWEGLEIWGVLVRGWAGLEIWGVLARAWAGLEIWGVLARAWADLEIRGVLARGWDALEM